MSRRNQVSMSPEEAQEYLAGARTMTVATIGAGGRPHLVAVWYAWLEGAPAFWTYARAQKAVNLRRDPRLTALVEDGDSYSTLRGVELVGRGVIVEDTETVAALAERLLDRYAGPGSAGPMVGPAREAMIGSAPKRVAVRIEVEKMVSWDHRKLGGLY
ncbi:MAG: pyridoxamine 5'-phosphate oxidase family protein [Acidimicrobiales bacterium]